MDWIVADDEKSRKLLAAKRLISGHSSEYAMCIARQVLENRKKFINKDKDAEKSEIAEEFCSEY